MTDPAIGCVSPAPALVTTVGTVAQSRSPFNGGSLAGSMAHPIDTLHVGQ